MADFPASMQRLVSELARLPSIGEKSATRLAYYLLNNNRPLALALSESLRKAAELVRLCERCFFLTDEPLCSICRNGSRDGYRTRC